ncbi:Uncharacterised protein [Vibrio cholerae]|nr:Uncharacterised protein [Vibrio cholerae]
MPAYIFGGRASSNRIRRLTRHVRGEITAAFRHDAQAAKSEHFQLDTLWNITRKLLHLMNGKHARQNDTFDVKILMIKFNGFHVGG